MVTVSGRVIDYSTRTPVPGTTVAWQGISDMRAMASRTVTTDEAGEYTVSVEPADIFRVTLAGRQTGTVIVPTRSYRTDFFINPGTCVLIYGIVSNAITKRPVSGARVTWLGEALTDSAGVFRIEPGCGRFYSGTTLFRVTHPAYAVVSTPSARGESFSNGAIQRIDHALMPLSESRQPPE